MARPTLFTHPKFVRLVHTLNLPRAHVLGHLELMWAVGYASGEPVLGDEIDVELASEWTGERGAWVRALSDPSVRLLDMDDNGRYAIHDLHDHAPSYVKDRWRKEQERKQLRRTRKSRKVRDKSGTVQEKSTTPAPTPAPTPTHTHAQEKGVGDKPHGSPPITATVLRDLWNEGTTPPIPKCRELTETRRRSAMARLRERSVEEWREVIARIQVSAFCRGETDRGSWVASFDWLLQPDTAVKVLEGKYDARSPSLVSGKGERNSRVFDEAYDAMGRTHG